MSWFKLWYDSVSALDTRTQGWTVSGTDAFGVPEEDVEGITVPGRNGTVLLPRNRWNNVERTFSVYIPQFRTGFDTLRQYALRCSNSYHMLEDEWNDAEAEPRFYMARVKSIKVDNTSPYFGSGTVTIVFDCQPQRWYKSGAVWHNAGEDYGDLITYNSSGDQTIVQPTDQLCPAALRFKCNGSAGRVYFNCMAERYVDVTPYYVGIWILIDAAAKTATYSEITNWVNRSDIQPEQSEWPVFGYWASLRYIPLIIKTEGNISNLQILPRWWTL